MNLAALIEEFIDLKVQGEPQGSAWRSIDEDQQERDRYRTRLQELRRQIDATQGDKEQA